MSDVSFTIQFDPANFNEEDLAATIKDQMHLAAPVLGNVLEDLVREKTPIDTGALQESATYELADDTSNDILDVFYDPNIQEQEWSRVYDVYQEGPPLGETTYTNGPRLMLQTTADTDGLGYLEVWAREQIEIAVERMADGSAILGGGKP